MLATLTLQLNSIELSAEVPNEPVSLTSAASHSQGENHTDFAQLLRSRVDTTLLSTTPEGDFLPPTGNHLPPTAVQLDVALIDDGAAVEGVTATLLDAEQTDESPLVAVADTAVDLTQAIMRVAVEPHGPIPEVTATLHAPVDGSNTATLTAASVTARNSGLPIPVNVTANAAMTLRTAELSVNSGAHYPAAAPVIAQVERSGVKLAPRSDAALLTSDQGTQTSDLQKLPVVAPAQNADVVRDKAIDRLRLPISEVQQFFPQSSPSGTAAVASAATPSGVTLPSFAADPGLASAAIDTPVRDSAWGDRISERVLMLAGGQLKTAEIRLTPAELGPLKIQVVIDDSTANVSFQSQHTVTRDAIEQALPRLRELLAENGLTLGQSSVSEQEVGKENQQEAAASKQQPAVTGNDASSSTAANASAASPLRTANGLIDTFV